MNAGNDGAMPSRSSNASALWTTLRIAGGIVGVATLLRLATIGFGVEYKAFFQQFLDQLRNIVELGFLIDPYEKLVVRPVLDWLRGAGWSLPELAPYWRSVFTLMWLLMLTTARHFPANAVARFPWAFACATIYAVTVGVTQMSPVTLLLSFVGANFVFTGGLLFLRPARSSIRYGASVVLCLLGLTVFIAAVFLNGMARPTSNAAGFPPLLVVTAIVGLWGATFLSLGLLDGLLGRRTWHEVFNQPPGADGLDIVGVMGAALFIGWIMLA